ncbi:MAG: radical SAM protein [Verrucomicrobiota bacterium]
MAKQAVRGLPYLQKELSRRLSLSTGKVLATPMTYYVIFSGRCNLECTFCTIYKEVDPILSAETMFRIVRETKELSGKGYNISLSGGEPMIFKPLYDTLALAQKLRVNFGFTTNGLGLTNGNVQKLLAYDPFNINVSLESVDPKINESLRPMKDGTRRTLEGIDNLLAEKDRTGSRVSIIVKPTIMEQNYSGLPALVRHFGKNSKVQISFQPYVGEIDKPFWIKDLEAFKGVLDEIRDLQRQGYSVVASDRALTGFLDYFSDPPQVGNMRRFDLGGAKRNCDIGLRSMFIYANGDVHFCDFLERAIGNVHKNSLSDIYYGTTAGGQRKEMIYCNIDCQQTCKRPIPLLVKARAFLRMG